MLDDDFVVSPEEDSSEEKDGEPEEIKTPKVYDPEWSNYVLSLLGDNDKFGDNPTRDGLRRIAEYLIGPIIRKTTHIIQAPKDKNGIATVSVTIVFHVKDGIPLFNCREINSISEDGSADCGSYNVESPFNLHQTATAETRAEARALRKVLRLHKVVAAEEVVDKSVIEKNKQEAVSNDNLEIDELITEEQANILEIMCQRCDISVIDLINIGKTKYDNIEKVPQSVAFKLIKYLNEIQQKVKEKHKSLKSYDPNWRME